MANFTRDDLNYLNMEEIGIITDRFNLPVAISYQNRENEVVTTSQLESKCYLLDKIYAYMNGERSFQPVVYPQEVVSFSSFKKSYSPDDFLLYNEFKSINKALIVTLKNLTEDAFYFGAIAFLEAHKLWRNHKKVTLKEYAAIWKTAINDHVKPLNEWAYIREMQNGMSKSQWKVHREKKSDEILTYLLKR